MITDLLAQVRFLYLKRCFDDALAVLDRFAEKNELTSEMLVLKGRLIQLAEPDKYELADAKKCFLKALEYDGDNVKAMLELGWLAFGVFDDVVEARDYFNRALATAEGFRQEAVDALEKCENTDLH
ncbi:tetratricopeptide repeat protein [Dyella sp. 2RAB6]|uniref:tetratricopeptide repeat protein n=1 Tax=Dyella sp. 2RAB6 TaxID=3232992 RepID=UPI003F93E5FE